MSSKPRGLGKGLGALIGGASGADLLRAPVGYINKEVAGARTAPDADILRIPVSSIEANPFQPREDFDREALEELAASIKALGLIQPITVRRTAPDRYQIISGERRFRACCMNGMTTVPAYVRETDDQGMLEMAIVENVQRQDLDPIEVAMGYRRLMDECSLTQEQLALRVGKKRATVTNSLRLLNLPPKVQHDLKVGLVSTGHAKVLLGIEDPAIQEKFCDLVVTGRLSVRELEDMVRGMRDGKLSLPAPGPAAPSAEAPLSECYGRLSDCMTRLLGKDVTVRRNASGKGSITIRFSSDEEVERFLTALEAR